MLAELAMAWTSLRNGFHAASGLMMMGDAPQSGLLAAPVDGKVSWTAHADLAEAAAKILVDDGRFDGPTPPLTGARALDLADLAEIASEVVGRPVRRQVIADEALSARMAERGAPPRMADLLLGFYIAGRNGEFAAIDLTLERLLGRSPKSMRDVMAAKLTN